MDSRKGGPWARIDAIGDGVTGYRMKNGETIVPATHTVVCDFDDHRTPARNSSDLCGGGTSSPDEATTAPGDSGCPIFQTDSQKGQWTIVGIASAGFDHNVDRCRIGDIFFATRVASYASFIDEVLRDKVSPPHVEGGGSLVHVTLVTKLNELIQAGRLTCNEAVDLYRITFPEYALGGSLEEGEDRASAKLTEREADSSTGKLLCWIEAQELSQAYPGYERHREYIDDLFAGLTQQQLKRFDFLWDEMWRIYPQANDRGLSQVKILEHVTEGKH